MRRRVRLSQAVTKGRRGKSTSGTRDTASVIGVRLTWRRTGYNPRITWFHTLHTSFFFSLHLAMSRFSRRPTRTQSRRLASSLSILFFALLAVLLLCPASVSADADEKKYGSVIGIGTLKHLKRRDCTLLTECRQIWVQRKPWKSFKVEYWY